MIKRSERHEKKNEQVFNEAAVKLHAKCHIGQSS